jgi:uncharacterized membrane protein required for colicin V production
VCLEGELKRMTRLDWTIVGFTAFTALMGFRQGFVRSALSLAGLAAGVVIGARLAPHFLAGGKHSHYTALLGLVGALVGASILRTAASSIGGIVRSTFRFAPPLRLIDSAGGLVVGAAWGLVVAWAIGAAAVQIPGHPSWHRDARQSHVLTRLNEFAPPGEVLRLRAGLLAQR